MKIALLGTGRMGLPMARACARPATPCRCGTARRAKAEPLAALGARIHATRRAAAVDGVPTVVGGHARERPGRGGRAVPQGVAKAMRPAALFIDMASIQPREARDHAARLGELGVSCLDAPVSGGTVGAENGTLVIMVGGKAAGLRARPARLPGVRPRHARGPARQRAAHQAGQPDDRRHHHRRRGRSAAAVRQGRRRHGQGARGHHRRLRRQPHPATARPAHGGARLRAARRMSVQLKDMRNALATARRSASTRPSRRCSSACTPTAWSTA
jgi:6-phosphogluconate dehydrogenase (decarboxylating)